MSSKKKEYLLQVLNIKYEFDKIKNALENPKIRIKKSQINNTSIVVLYAGAKEIRARVSPVTLKGLIESLQHLKDDLRVLINKIDRRSLHLFKTGNFKEFINQAISVQNIVDLTRKAKSCHGQLQAAIVDHKMRQVDENAQVALSTLYQLNKGEI